MASARVKRSMKQRAAERLSKQRATGRYHRRQIGSNYDCITDGLGVKLRCCNLAR